MEWNMFVITLALVTLGAGLAVGGYQMVRTRRAQRRGETSAFAHHRAEK